LAVSEPVVGIEGVVPDVFVRLTVKLPSTGFCRYLNCRAGVLSYIRLVL
jgi:hypothetical protein